MAQWPEQVITQQQKLSSKMIGSLALLRMTEDQLYEYTDTVFLENPFLEYKRPLLVKNSIVTPELLGDPDNPLETLAFFLKDQISRLPVSKEDKRTLLAMADLVDERGYLPPEDRGSLPIAQDRLQHTVNLLQTLEPAGVGAADLRECLLLQLERLPGGNAAAKLIVSSCLEEMAAGAFHAISKKTGLSESDIQSAVQLIRTLNPKPGASFYSVPDTQFIFPDYYVRVTDGRLEILRNEERSIELQISPEYEALYKERRKIDSESARFLGKSRKDAKLLIYQLGQRETTTLRCVEAIVRSQQGWFLKNELLRPLSLKTLSKELSVSQSTVCRAINGRYMEFENHVYPTSYFLAKSSRGQFREDISVYHVQELISEIIRNEEPDHPTSDTKISELLAAGGIKLSRHSVAKYRNALGIPPAAERRKRI